MPKDILDGRISIASIARIGKEDETRLSQHKLEKGDIVYGRRGDIGRRALVTAREQGWLCGTGCLRLSLGDSVLNPAFLYYYLGLQRTTAWISNQAIGATLPNLNTSILRSVPIVFPSLPVQKRIASILSAYDDLIENNARRIRILEEMAQAIYREWFVHFRFPRHKNVKLVNSSLGPIPEGWSIARLSEVAAVNELSIRRGEEPEEIVYVDIASVSPGSIDEKKRVKFGDAPGRARRIVRHGDTIWSMVRPNRKSFSLILDPEPNLIVSTGFAVLSAAKVPFSYLYHAVTTEDFAGYLANRATGAAYPAVKGEDFKGAQVLRPNTVLLERFHALAAPMLEMRESLARKNRNLRQTRDLLLPQLISGDLDVSDLNIQVAGAG